MKATHTLFMMSVLVAAVGAALADDITWDHNGADFNTAANWDPQQVPGSDDRAIFGVAPETDPEMNPNLSASVTVNRLFFEGSGYTLSGEAITPTSTTTGGSGDWPSVGIYMNSAGTNTISAPITYTGGGQISVAANGTLILAGPITRSGTIRMRPHSTGTLRLTGSNTTGTGSINLDGGIFEIGHDGVFGDASMNTFVAESTLFAYDGDRTIGNNIVVDQGRRITVDGSNNLEWSGNVTIRGLSATPTTGWNNEGTGLLTLSGNVFLSSADVQKTMHLGGSGAIVISGNIADFDGTTTTRNNIGLDGTAGSSVLFSGTNTYTGDTTIGANSSFTLDEVGSLMFHIEDAANNWITGTGAATFNGTFVLAVGDVTVDEGEWTLVNVGSLNETFGATFAVALDSAESFSDIGGGLYRLDAANNIRWEFDRNSGKLTVQVRPPAGTVISIK